MRQHVIDDVVVFDCPATAVGPALYEEATTGVTFTQDFNPYESSSLAHGLNLTSLVYEPLTRWTRSTPLPRACTLDGELVPVRERWRGAGDHGEAERQVQ